MKARPHARHQLYRKGIFDVRIFGEGMAEMAGQRRHKVWQRLGQNSLNAKIWGLRLVF